MRPRREPPAPPRTPPGTTTSLGRPGQAGRASRGGRRRHGESRCAPGRRDGTGTSTCSASSVVSAKPRTRCTAIGSSNVAARASTSTRRGGHHRRDQRDSTSLSSSLAKKYSSPPGATARRPKLAVAPRRRTILPSDATSTQRSRRPSSGEVVRRRRRADHRVQATRARPAHYINDGALIPGQPAKSAPEWLANAVRPAQPIDLRRRPADPDGEAHASPHREGKPQLVLRPWQLETRPVRHARSRSTTPPPTSRHRQHQLHR